MINRGKKQRKDRRRKTLDKKTLEKSESSFFLRHTLLIYGATASVSYGLWGFFDKLAHNQSLPITNFIIYGVAFLISLFGLKYKRGPSWTALMAGICGGAINALILLSLARHKLILVYPFVSFGTVFFVALTFFFLRGEFVTHSRIKLVAGIFVSLTGLILCGIGLSGGLTNIAWNSFDIESICIGLLISLFTGLWVFFAFYTVVKQGYTPLVATTWVFSGSFLLSISLLLFNTSDLSNYQFSSATTYAVLGGIAMFVGEYFTYKAFSIVPDDSQRLDQTLAVFLSNSELVPVIILSVVFLREITLEGILGAVLVFCGLVILNTARANKDKAV